jgi:hypothetical protein
MLNALVALVLDGDRRAVARRSMLVVFDACRLPTDATPPVRQKQPGC